MIESGCDLTVTEVRKAHNRTMLKRFHALPMECVKARWVTKQGRRLKTVWEAGSSKREPTQQL